MSKAILGLKLPTDPRWVNLVEISIEEILTDHAYCEMKAAQTCMSLIQKYSDRAQLVDELAPIAAEEWGHFRLVLAELKKRGLTLGRNHTDDYVNSLLNFERKGGHIERQLMDKLLINAMIEARSCERFRLLSEGLKDVSLRKFYRTFMVSEAGHYRLFVHLAKEYMPAKIVKQRWNELVIEEAAIMENLKPRGERMH
jgi:tRNA 2-(methylsulfanyl)-N6-isopentenyladenosine37 hydroxylase